MFVKLALILRRESCKAELPYARTVVGSREDKQVNHELFRES